jgi:hypothetical protein
MADRVRDSLSGATNKVHAQAGITGDQLAADVRAAQAKAASPPGGA